MCTCDFGGVLLSGIQYWVRLVFHIQGYSNLVMASPSVTKYYRDPIVVLYCRPHCQVVHMAVWSSQKQGVPKGPQLKILPNHSPLKLGSGKFFGAIRIKMVYTDKKSLFVLEVNILTRFLAFSVILILYIYILHITGTIYSIGYLACFRFKLNM